MKAADLDSDRKQYLLELVRGNIGISQYDRLRRTHTEDEIVDLALKHGATTESTARDKWGDVFFVILWGVASVIAGVIVKDVRFIPAIFSAPFMLLLTRPVFPKHQGRQVLWGIASAVVFILSVLWMKMKWPDFGLLVVGSVFAAGVVGWIADKIMWIGGKIRGSRPPDAAR